MIYTNIKMINSLNVSFFSEIIYTNYVIVFCLNKGGSMNKFLKEFKEFISKGNLMDMAVLNCTSVLDEK